MKHEILATVRLDKRSPDDPSRCICCPDGIHVYCTWFELDEFKTGYPEHFGRGPEVWMKTVLDHLYPHENRRVRITVEVLDGPEVSGLDT